MFRRWRKLTGFDEQEWASLTSLEKQWVVALWLLTVGALLAVFVYVLAGGSAFPSGYGWGKIVVFGIAAPYVGYCLWVLGRKRRGR